MRYMYDSSQCKIVKAIITATGEDRAGNEVHCEDKEYNIEEIWFRNKKLLTEEATKMGLMASAWCRLEQEQAYMWYKDRNENNSFHYNQREIDYRNGETDSIGEVPDYFTMDDKLTVSNITELEDQDAEFK